MTAARVSVTLWKFCVRCDPHALRRAPSARGRSGSPAVARAPAATRSVWHHVFSPRALSFLSLLAQVYSLVNLLRFCLSVNMFISPYFVKKMLIGYKILISRHFPPNRQACFPWPAFHRPSGCTLSCRFEWRGTEVSPFAVLSAACLGFPGFLALTPPAVLRDSEYAVLYFSSV